MTDSNRVRLSYVEESTFGTTPSITSSLPMSEMRITGEGLTYNINNVISEEIRSDRQIPDLIRTNASNGGDIGFELSHPLQPSFLDQFISASLYNNWTLAPEKFNVVADTAIANVAAGTGVYTLDAGGASFVLGHLVRATGFTNAANNGVFRVSANTATTVTTGNSSSVLEAAPPAGAFFKVVGFSGVSGDITATATGLGSTTLDFTTLGIVVGQWLKVGGTAAGDRFNTSLLNTWVRVTAIAATALTCDNLPVGWTTDAGTGKTIKVWFGDYIRNGTTRRSFTIEKAFLGQATPSYLTYLGMVPVTMSLNLQTEQVITGSFGFMGATHATSTSSLGTPVAATVENVMSAGANVARLAENGSVMAAPSLASSLSLSVNNNGRMNTAIGQIGPFNIGAGRCEVSGSLAVYFGDKTLYDKYINGTATNLNFRSVDGVRAIVCTLPNVEFENAPVNASSANQDVIVNLGFRAIRDATTNCEIQLDRFSYWE